MIQLPYRDDNMIIDGGEMSQSNYMDVQTPGTGTMIIKQKRNTKSYKTELELEVGRKKLWVKRFKWVLMVALVELMVILMWL